MKTNMTPATVDYKLHSAYGSEFAIVTLPVYEDKPNAIVHDDVIYLPTGYYPYTDYRAVRFIHVVTAVEFNPINDEPEPAAVEDKPATVEVAKCMLCDLPLHDDTGHVHAKCFDAENAA